MVYSFTDKVKMAHVLADHVEKTLIEWGKAMEAEQIKQQQKEENVRK